MRTALLAALMFASGVTCRAGNFGLSVLDALADETPSLDGGWIYFTLSPRMYPGDHEKLETERAFAQIRAADVLVSYESSTRISAFRDSTHTDFTSEALLLRYLESAKEPKGLLVVTLGKGQSFSEPGQTVEGFWKACKAVGFDLVVIHQAHSQRGIILYE